MISSNLEYSIVLLASLIFPLLLSFHPKSKLKNKTGLVFLTIIIVSIPWIIWDIYATHRGHWGFNYDYVFGPKLVNLPLEEVAFFIVIPYCCLFLWSVIRSFKNWPTFFKELMNKK